MAVDVAVDARELQAAVGYLHAGQFSVNKWSALDVAGSTTAVTLIALSVM